MAAKKRRKRTKKRKTTKKRKKRKSTRKRHTKKWSAAHRRSYKAAKRALIKKFEHSA